MTRMSECSTFVRRSERRGSCRLRLMFNVGTIAKDCARAAVSTWTKAAVTVRQPRPIRAGTHCSSTKASRT